MKGRAAAVASVVLAGAVVLRAATDVRVTPFVSEGRVLASFSAPSAWTPEARALVKGGVGLTFAFEVELRRPSVLLDATLVRTSVTSEVKYDTLTQSFQVSKLREGQMLESSRTELEPEVREWATTFQRLPLEPPRPLEPNGEYYVQVRLVVSPRRNVSLWSLWPFGRNDASGRADFTFIR
jgi:hypothetical protein